MGATQTIGSVKEIQGNLAEIVPLKDFCWTCRRKRNDKNKEQIDPELLLLAPSSSNCERVLPKLPCFKREGIKLKQRCTLYIPFKRTDFDIWGPVPTVTRRGRKVILTMVDFGMRYPEAIALSSIETAVVAEAMILGLLQTGISFYSTSNLMQRLWQMCGIQHLTPIAYHPETNGFVERFNRTLVHMLKSYMAEHPAEWDAT